MCCMNLVVTLCRGGPWRRRRVGNATHTPSDAPPPATRAHTTHRRRRPMRLDHTASRTRPPRTITPTRPWYVDAVMSGAPVLTVAPSTVRSVGQRDHLVTPRPPPSFPPPARHAPWADDGGVCVCVCRADLSINQIFRFDALESPNDKWRYALLSPPPPPPHRAFTRSQRRPCVSVCVCTIRARYALCVYV